MEKIIDHCVKFNCVNCNKEYFSPQLSDGMPLMDIFCDDICGQAYYSNPKKTREEYIEHCLGAEDYL